MACDKCGARGKNHLAGCEAIGGAGGHRRGGPGKDTPKHKHKYILVNVTEFDMRDGRTLWHYTIKHFECAGEGQCDRPYYDDTTRKKV